MYNFRSSFVFITILFVSLFRLAAYGQPNLPEVSKKLEGWDIAVRREAMTMLLENTRESWTNAMLPLLTKGLEDSDTFVRQASANMISAIAFGNRMVSKSKITVDLSSYPPLREALVKAIRNEDQVVRNKAIRSIYWGFGPIPNAESILETQLVIETNPHVRGGIVSLLGLYSSEKAIKAIINALEDEEADVRRSAAIEIKRLKPPSALPKLISALKVDAKGVNDKEYAAIERLVSTIIVYGAAAKDYLPQLEEKLAKAKDERVKQELQRAVGEIEVEIGRVSIEKLIPNDAQRVLSLTVGREVKLHIIGVYSNGIKKSLQGTKKGTTYETSDPKIASADTEGLITGVAPGMAVVTARNGKLQVEVPLTVKN